MECFVYSVIVSQNDAFSDKETENNICRRRHGHAVLRFFSDEGVVIDFAAFRIWGIPGEIRKLHKSYIYHGLCKQDDQQGPRGNACLDFFCDTARNFDARFESLQIHSLQKRTCGLCSRNSATLQRSSFDGSVLGN